jgi:hypothetical protein
MFDPAWNKNNIFEKVSIQKVSRDAKERYTSRKAFQIEQTGSAMYIICFIYATSLGVVKAAYCQAAAMHLIIWHPKALPTSDINRLEIFLTKNSDS